MFVELHLDDFRIFNNQKIQISETITAIAGHNATGKSTVLGILGNSSELKSKDGTTVTDKAFKTEFSELFRGSKKHDKEKGTIGTILFQFEGDNEPTEIGLRVTWQKWAKTSKEKNRFRIIPHWIDKETQKITAKKLPVPSYYLGLSRLFPLGENNKEFVEERKFKNSITEDEYKWLVDKYKQILSLNTNVDSISNFELIKKRSGGVNTEKYDYLSNSSGQDNLMQIMYMLLSFKKLKEKYQTTGYTWQGGLLLIDEIDATLHPAAQIRLTDLIYEMCKTYKFQCIFTTHSLQILSHINTMKKRKKDIGIEYFTTANNILQIKHNPSYVEMENDMLISNYYTSNAKQKLLVYSEDEEARWFIQKLLKAYQSRVQILDIKLGCTSLMNLLENDPDYFKNVLFILDGDANLENTKYKDFPRDYCNIILLPGTGNPEQVVYEYLINLPPNHPILVNNAEKGISLRLFEEMNPLTNSKYRSKTEPREKYKQWFKDSLVIFDDIDLYRYWSEDNDDLVQAFIDTFLNRYNIVASRSNLPLIR